MRVGRCSASIRGAGSTARCSRPARKRHERRQPGHGPAPRRAGAGTAPHARLDLAHVPAIERWPDNMSLWHEWEAIYCRSRRPRQPRSGRASSYEQHRAAMDAGAELLWPEEEDLYTLMCMRVEGRPHGLRAREARLAAQSRAVRMARGLLRRAHLVRRLAARACSCKIVALDPSKGRDARRGDYSAFVMLGVDRQGVLYVEADLARRPTPEMVADGRGAVPPFRPDAFGVETNQFQELLAGEFDAEFRRQGIVGVQPWSIDNRVNKLVRIRRLGPYLSARRLRFKADSPGTRLLVEQLQQFPVGDHDDGPDALEMAIRLAGELFGGDAAGDGLGDRLPRGRACRTHMSQSLQGAIIMREPTMYDHGSRHATAASTPISRATRTAAVRSLAELVGQLRRPARSVLGRRRRLAAAGRAARRRSAPATRARSSTKQQLREIRDQCRALAVTNEFAINGHENRISYMVGAGHTYRAAVQERARRAGRAVRRPCRPCSTSSSRQPLASPAAGDRPPLRSRRRSLSAVLRRRPTARRGCGSSSRARSPRRTDRAGDPAASFGILTEPDDVETPLAYLRRRPAGRRRPRSSIARPTSTPT